MIDSSVLLDVVTRDPNWFEWSSEALGSAADDSELCINPLIYAETSIRFDSPKSFDDLFPESMLKREPLPYTAAFLAGRAHIAYKRRGGSRISPLPDFFIRAHAAVSGHRILTRDPRRFRRYFPSVELIAPR